MAGAEEPELSDEELLGAATLAKISSHSMSLNSLRKRASSKKLKT